MAMRAAIVLWAGVLVAGTTGYSLGQTQVRFATFNASLNRKDEGKLMKDLATTDDAQAKVIAEIIQRTNPDVLFINEFDYDSEGTAAQRFQDNYLSVSQHGATPVKYPFRCVAPSNTGMPSGFDLDNSGSIGGPNDALGFGNFPGQYGMVIYSKYPIQNDGIRTFQKFLWKDMPGAMLPDDPKTKDPADWYTQEELSIIRLSSKGHWDVPIDVNGQTVHVLASHPTPPTYDGPEDRNGTRNHDEIRMWADYITPSASNYLYDDKGAHGGLDVSHMFVIVGDHNADPLDGDSVAHAIGQLLNNPRVNVSLTPTSAGGPDAAARQSGVNKNHVGDPATDTADFGDKIPGNLRVDYVLPSTNLKLESAGVFWPSKADPLFNLVGDYPFPGSDHRLVWAEVTVPAPGHVATP